LSDSYVSLIESGKRTPTPAVLELLAQKLDCSLSYLVNGVTAEQMEDIELALGYARLALENGEVTEARTRFAELMANNNLTGLTALRQDTEYGLALATEACGDLDQAIVILTRLRQEELPYERQVELAIALCRVLRDGDQLTEAVKVGEELLTAATRPAWSDVLVELGATLLGAYFLRGDLLRARQYAAELLNVADALGTPRSIVAANWNAAIVAETIGHGEEALTFAERALAIQSESGRPRNLARVRLAYAGLSGKVRPGSVQDARALVVRASQELAETSASSVDRANGKLELAKLDLITGQYEQAITHASAGRDLLPTTSRTSEAGAHLILSYGYAGQNRTTEAASELAAVRSWLAPLPASRRVAGNWYAAADAMEELGDTEGAVEAYQKALTCAGL
jgi:tetratricopeptide (TPR) repeat protein